MGRKNIRKYSLSYLIVQLLAGILFNLYYKRFQVIGRKKVPKGVPVIFAINHQNALMDALAIVFGTMRQVVFLARADIFKKKFAAALLYFLKILPIYRIRDGLRAVDQNQEVFDETVRILQCGRPMGILPEGNHLGMKRLRPLTKGAARLAMLAEEASGFNLGLKIVPVGLDYSNYFNAGSDLLVVFGEPINAADYTELYRKSPPQALVKLTEDLRPAMLKVMIHIESEEYYDTIFLASDIAKKHDLKVNKVRPTLYNSFLARKKVVERLDELVLKGNERMKELKVYSEEYAGLLKKYALRDHVVARKRSTVLRFVLEVVMMTLLLPLHLYGMVLNYLPYALPIRLTSSIKDRHFLGSVRFVTGLLFFLIWYLLILIVLCFIPAGFIFKLLLFLSIPLTGILSFHYYRHLLKMAGELRWIRLKSRNRKEFERISGLRGRIVELLAEILLNTD
jgi:1-acyl-sn-glycerol-3-phosphate acyltransferase